MRADWHAVMLRGAWAEQLSGTLCQATTYTFPLPTLACLNQGWRCVVSAENSGQGARGVSVRYFWTPHHDALHLPCILSMILKWSRGSRFSVSRTSVTEYHRASRNLRQTFFSFPEQSPQVG
ncbi:hypothetical protein BKA63DRAFT_29268 [Paraphoma chrysanthemicola]|nr:hypothetical protein BKA63DRAFT_29268 [Paraphoma chrysanthemicola]